MRILDVHSDNAPFFQELAQAKRRVLVVDYDSVIAPCSAPSGVPYPTVTELLDCIMTTSRTRVVVITAGEAAELASPLSGPASDLWESDAPRGPDAMFPGMLSRLGEDTAVAFLSDRDRLFPALPEAACGGAENPACRQDFVQFLVDWLRVCGGEIC
ncbi:MAG: hypothetical protein WA188_17405 [Terriglobales bacterium]